MFVGDYLEWEYSLNVYSSPPPSHTQTFENMRFVRLDTVNYYTYRLAGFVS